MQTIERFVILTGIVLANYSGFAATKEIGFTQSTNSVAVYDYVEVSLQVSPPPDGNPFTDATVTGFFGLADGSEPVKVDGFCDSADGTLFKIRFMPSKPGRLRLHDHVLGEGPQ